MPPQLATLIFASGIAALFLLNRDPTARTSRALWLPVFWLLIGGSRNVGEWLHLGAPADPSARYLEGNPVDRNVLSGLILLGIVALVSRRGQVWAVLVSNVPILLYVSYCALSILWSYYPYVAFKRWNRAVGDVVMVLIILTDRDKTAAVKRVLARVSFLLLPLSMLFIKYYPDLGRAYSRSEGRMFWTGVTTDKNGLGLACLIFGLASAWQFLGAYQDREDRHRFRRLIAHGTIVALVVILMHNADSATALASLLLAGSLMVLTSRPAVARRTALVHLFVLGAICLPLYALFLDSRGGLVGSLGRDPTLTGRTEVWRVALQFSGSPLFGTGFESFWIGDRLESILRILPGLNEAHNGYLEVYLNLGWTGVFLLGAVMIMGYRNVVVALRRDTYVGPLNLAYVVATVIYNLTEAGVKMMSPVWIMFLLATMDVTKRTGNCANLPIREPTLVEADALAESIGWWKHAGTSSSVPWRFLPGVDAKQAKRSSQLNYNETDD